MNREEVLAMEVDGWILKLSAVVAIEVMGWHRHSETKTWIDQDGNEKAHWRWSPEIDISAAWPVVEKMEQDGWNWDASGRIGRENVEPFKRFYFKPNKYDPVYPLSSIIRADGKQLPEAICKAALLAKLTQEVT